ncbi:hypothetical protein IID23_01545 [Patescibacteria group bacterium]|nr:hypothetical protein [Patescibacteria group bacterium]
MDLIGHSLSKIYVLEEHSEINYSIVSSPNNKGRFLLSQLKSSIFITWLVQAIFFGVLWLIIGLYGSNLNLGPFSQIGLLASIIHFGFAFAIIIPIIISLLHTSNVVAKTKSIDVSMFTLLVFPLITFLFAPGTIAALYFLFD